MRRFVLGAAVFAVVFAPAHAEAHKPSDSYVTLRASAGELTGRWDIALRDLDDAVGLDTDGDGTLTWGEVRSRYPAALSYALPRLGVRAGAKLCRGESGPPRIVRHADGSYLALELVWHCEAPPRAVSLRYDLLFERDAAHRGIVHVVAGASEQTVVLTARERERTLTFGESARASQFFRIVRLGLEHIWTGYDHLLFLLALLLPAVLRRDGRRWVPVASIEPTAREVLRTVTAFTLAHSLTLALAALGIVELPARFVEAAIALSVVLAAVNNLWPLVRAERWIAAFGLGLLHGFGFASALAGAGLAGQSLTTALFGFNAGVELGQLAVVLALLPLAYAARRRPLYTRWALGGGSAAVALVAGVWFVERAFAVRLMS